MTSKPILYGTYTSPGVNAVLMTFKALNVDFDFREVKPSKNENQTPEYLCKNPTGTIPALETEEHQFIGDSHAITCYLVDRYGKDDSLYPKDLYKRAKVHQLQHFSNSVIFTSCVKPVYAHIIARQSATVPGDIMKNVDGTYTMMERFLDQNKWMAGGDQLTIADFNCICAMHGMRFLRQLTRESHPHLNDWYERMMAIPCVLETLSSAPMKASMRFVEKHLSKM